MATMISAQALKTLMESDTLYAVLDVRDWGEFTLEQIPGTNSLPRGHLEKYVAVLVPKKDIHVILYCDTGERSARAAATLESLDYSDVSVLDGGLREWKAAGYETIHGWSLRGKEYGERLQVEEDIPEMTAARSRGTCCALGPAQCRRFCHCPYPWRALAVAWAAGPPDRTGSTGQEDCGRVLLSQRQRVHVVYFTVEKSGLSTGARPPGRNRLMERREAPDRARVRGASRI